ncbi:MAG: hypothetical protein ACXIU8_04705 [Alkalilacustris sp.]
MSLPRALRIALLVWPFAMVVLGLLYMTVPPSPDQSQFDWMAFTAINGLPFYSGSFDMNWPGKMWLHEAGIRLFGVNPWTWRLTDFLLMLGFALAGWAFLAQAGWRVAGVLFLLLYPPLYITAGSWMAGQRDIVAAGFLLAACAASLPGGRAEVARVVLAGVLVAAAVLIRPTYLSFLAGLMLLEALPLATSRPRRSSRSHRALGLLAGFTLGLAVAIAAGVMLGNLRDWYEQSILFALSVYAGSWPQDPVRTIQIWIVQSWHFPGVLGLGGLVLWAWRDRVGHALVLALGIAATAALSFAVQGKGFGYHLGGILLVLVLLTAVALEALETLRRRAGSQRIRTALTVTLMLAATLAVAGTAKKLSNLSANAGLLLAGELGPLGGSGLTEAERRHIVAMIRAGSGPDDTVTVFGTNYDLPFRAERLPSYRFFTPAADAVHPGFALHDVWLAEIDAALIARRPAFVIVQQRWIDGPAEAPRPVPRTGPILARLVAHLQTGYVPVFENEALIVYRDTLR